MTKVHSRQVSMRVGVRSQNPTVKAKRIRCAVTFLTLRSRTDRLLGCIAAYPIANGGLQAHEEALIQNELCVMQVSKRPP